MVDADADGCGWYTDDLNTFLNGKDSEDIAEGCKNQRRSERTAAVT